VNVIGPNNHETRKQMGRPLKELLRRLNKLLASRVGSEQNTRAQTSTKRGGFSPRPWQCSAAFTLHARFGYGPQPSMVSADNNIERHTGYEEW
jgi:hypothetical protein